MESTYDLYENLPTDSWGVLSHISKILQYHWAALVPITVLKLIVASILVALHETCAGIFTGIFSPLLFIVAFIVGNLFLSTFAYAFNHALVQIYAGENTPSPLECIQYGYMQKWHVFWYLLLVSFLHVSLKFMFENMSLIYFILLTVLDVYVVMLGIPVIVVEQKSAVGAFKRSYSLFWENAGFLFCSRINFLVWGITFLMVGFFSAVVSGSMATMYILGTVIFLVSQTMYSIVSFVLYMSIRIRNEGITQTEFSQSVAENGVAISSVNDYGVIPGTDTELISHGYDGLPYPNAGVGSGDHFSMV